MMKVAIICDCIDDENITGIGNYQISFISRLIKRKQDGLDSDINYVFIHKKYNKLTQNFENIIIEKNSGFVSSIKYWFQRLIKLPVTLKSKNITILHNLNYAGPIYFDLIGRHKKITTLYDFIPLLYKDFSTKMEILFSKLGLKYVLKKSDLVLSISENTRNDGINFGIKKENIKTIYIGAENKSQIYKNLKSENIYGKYLLGVSSIAPHKNISFLIKGFIEVKKDTKFKDLKLVLVGQNRLHVNGLNKLIEESGIKNDIIFTGFIDDKELINLYKNALVFISPSIYEGFGLPILEAMQYGCPVIGNNSSSIPEVINDAGILVETNNINDLKINIVKLIEDNNLRNELIIKGYENIKKFDLDKMIENIINIYKDF